MTVDDKEFYFLLAMLAMLLARDIIERVWPRRTCWKCGGP